MIFEIHDYTTMKDAIARFCLFLTEKKVPSERVFDSRLIASELLGNVLRHSDGKAKLQGGVKDGFVEVTVYSSVVYVPPKISKNADVLAENGRGLYLIDSLCAERTVTPDGGILVKIKY